MSSPLLWDPPRDRNVALRSQPRPLCAFRVHESWAVSPETNAGPETSALADELHEQQPSHRPPGRQTSSGNDGVAYVVVRGTAQSPGARGLMLAEAAVADVGGRVGWSRSARGLRLPIKRGMISVMDAFYSDRRAWRHPDTDPRTLSALGQLLWVVYTPVRSLQWRLIPRGHQSYPPRSLGGRARAWLVRHL